AVRPVTVAGLACELRIRKRGHVDEPERDVGEEGLARCRLSPDEGGGPRRDLRVHAAMTLQVERGDLPGLLALAGFVDGLRGNEVRRPALPRAHRRPQAVRLGHGRPHGVGVAARYPVPLVEALVGGESVLDAAEVPLAPRARGVTPGREQLRY